MAAAYGAPVPFPVYHPAYYAHASMAAGVPHMAGEAAATAAAVAEGKSSVSPSGEEASGSGDGRSEEFSEKRDADADQMGSSSAKRRKSSNANAERDYCFYPSWIYALPTWILKIPISFVECAVWIAMTYYGIGFDPNIERFFRHYLVLVLVSQLASGLFRLLASLGREMVLANTFGSFAQLIMLALSGFIISRENIRKWWVWGYWASPLMFAQNLIAQNEFLGHKWNKTTDHSFSKDTLGVQILKARGIFVDPNWYWIGVGGLIAYILLF